MQMPDREKVKNALWRCESYGYCEDTGCPYYENTSCLELLRKDAFALLKEQEPVKPEYKLIPGSAKIHEWECGNCGNDLYFEQRFCDECGKAVKWND